MNRSAAKPSGLVCEICILAGGLSQRMGRDKSRLRLGKKTLLGHIRAAAKGTNYPVRIIRRDLVERCGPLGGVYTALKTTRAKTVLFLACDMPFVSKELLERLFAKFLRNGRAHFSREDDAAGFPFVLSRTALALVEQQLARKEFSLQKLAKVCRARKFSFGISKEQLLNLNTPADWKSAQQIFSRKA